METLKTLVSEDKVPPSLAVRVMKAFDRVRALTQPRIAGLLRRSPPCVQARVCVSCCLFCGVRALKTDEAAYHRHTCLFLARLAQNMFVALERDQREYGDQYVRMSPRVRIRLAVM